MLDDFSGPIKEVARTPAADHSFQVREAPKLEFCNMAARGLLAHKRARQDAQLAMSFACT